MRKISNFSKPIVVGAVVLVSSMFFVEGITWLIPNSFSALAQAGAGDEKEWEFNYWVCKFRTRCVDLGAAYVGPRCLGAFCGAWWKFWSRWLHEVYRVRERCETSMVCIWGTTGSWVRERTYPRYIRTNQCC